MPSFPDGSATVAPLDAWAFALERAEALYDDSRNGGFKSSEVSRKKRVKALDGSWIGRSRYPLCGDARRQGLSKASSENIPELHELSVCLDKVPHAFRFRGQKGAKRMKNFLRLETTAFAKKMRACEPENLGERPSGA